MNTLYDSARRRMLSNQLDWATMPVRMLAFASQYTFDPTHEVINDMGVAIAAQSELFTNKSVTPDGYAKSDQAWFQNVPLTLPWIYLVIVDETQGGLARQLIAFYDEGYNLPRQPNGQDQIVIPDWFSHQGWFRP